MTINDDAEHLLQRPGEPRPTWTSYGHPELENEPLIQVFGGQAYRAPALPPVAGPRWCDGHIWG